MFVDTQVRPQGEQQVGKLKLSEAIRIGAKIRPQCASSYFANGGSCVMGAAWEGSGNKAEGITGIAWRIMQRFGIAEELGRSIVIRNDSGESRESIADWLESQGL